MLTLSTLRDFLRERRNASLGEMALHFDASPDAVRGVLAHWQAKDKVRLLPLGSTCSNAGSGCGCGCKAAEIFEWVEPAGVRH